MLFLLLSCSPKNSSVIDFHPKTLKIESIEGLNLSEDMSSMSSMQDEILCKITLVTKINNAFQIEEEATIPILKFNSKTKRHSIEQSFDLKESLNRYLVFSLVEIDNENSSQVLNETLSDEIKKGTFLNLQSSLQIDTLIGDDDFLGMKFIDFSKVPKPGRRAIKISGRQLFDKYDYRIYYHFE